MITDADHLTGIRERIEVRIKQSMEYFYPLKDRDKARQVMSENQLQLVVGQVLSSEGPFADVEVLKKAVNTYRSFEG